MPLVPMDERPATLRRILDGEVDVVLWGLPEEMAAFLWQTGLKPKAIYDTKWRLWGRSVDGVPIRPPTDVETLDAERSVLLCFYEGTPVFNSCLAFIAERSAVPVIANPTHLDFARAAGAGTGDQDGTVEDVVAVTRDILARMPQAAERAMALGAMASATKRRGLLADLLEWTIGVLAQERGAPARTEATLYINSLFAGGAERQVCELAVGLKENGWRPRLMMLDAMGVESPHYLAFLEEQGIDHHSVPRPDELAEPLAPLLASLPEPLRVFLWHLPHILVPRIARTYRATVQRSPRVAVCYLDWPSVNGGIGALCAGAEHVVLSGRNVHPGNFPHFFAYGMPLFEECYTLLTDNKRVVLSNNSSAGARSYAQWLGLPDEDVAVVPNCVAAEAVSAAEAPRPPREDGAPPTVLGVFRLAPEKNPLLFLDVIDRLRGEYPDLRAIMCGDGPSFAEVAKEVRLRGLSRNVTLRGVVGDVASLMRRADILLHTANFEGTPNVILEAQAVGLPVVCTDAGGTMEVVSQAVRPFVFPLGDGDGLTAACLRLLRDPALRADIGAQAAAETLTTFSRQALVARTLESAGLAPVPGEPLPA